VLAIIFLNTPILVYYGLKKTLLYIAVAWTTLSSIIIGLDILLGSFKLDYLYNLLYGYASFTSILLFFSTTTPREIRRLIGFNVLSLSYLFLDYSYRVLTDALHSLQARGLTPSRNLSWVKYLLRSTIVLLVIRINEVEEALRARGVD
jgi:energy-coupling factor transport system permease protein